MKRAFLKNIGFKYTHQGKSLILQLISMTKENQNLTNAQIESFIKATSTYFDQISNKKDLQELFGNLDFVFDDTKNYHGTFYKYILCGTPNIEQQEKLAKKFGGYVMKINNIGSFAEKVKKAVGAEYWQLRKVNYTDYKAFNTEVHLADLDGVSPDLSDELFNILIKISENPSIFSKPVGFIDEQELRLVFSMPRDVKRLLNFDNLGLLEEIEIIK